MITPETKETIFDKTIELISEFGFESVGMRTIAKYSGIKAPTIYNYFKKKEDILDFIYEYYLKYMAVGHSNKEKRQKIIQEGSLEDIAYMLTEPNFVRLEQKQAARMMIITKIIYTRMYYDQQAAELFVKSTDVNKKYIQSALDYGIGIERFKKFDAEIYATIIVSIYQILGIREFIQPGYSPKLPSDETKMIQWIIMLLNFVDAKH